MRLKNRRMNDKLFDFVVILLTVLFLIVTVYPVYYCVIASVSDPTKVLNGEIVLLPMGLNLKGYKDVFTNSQILTGFLNTIIYAFGGTAINLLVTLPAAYTLSRKEFVARKFINLFFTFTMFFNGGLIATYLVIKELGFINSRWVFVIPFCLNVYNLIIVRSFFENSVPEELWEAAKMDGCNHFKYFLSVTIPLSKAVISVITLYYLVAHWNDFFTGMMYTRNAAIQPLQNVLRSILLDNQVTSVSGQSFFQIAYQQQLKYAVIIVSTIPLLIIYPFVQKYFDKGVMIGAVKG